MVLAAAECLPPGTITGVVLLAPCVSCKYNICPVLAAACEGVDVFSSHLDFINLSFTLTGTSDLRFLVGSAGFHGFKSAGCCDFAANLRQHPNSYTGHFGCIQREFLIAQVLPILQTCTEIISAPPGAAKAPPDRIRSAGYASPAAREQRFSTCWRPWKKWTRRRLCRQLPRWHRGAAASYRFRIPCGYHSEQAKGREHGAH